MIDFTASYTDQYQLAMAQTYFLQKQNEQFATFDYFFRKLPFEGGYAVFAGLADLLKILEDLRFDDDDIKFLRQQKFDSRFIDYLKKFRFRGTIYSCFEGEIVFPISPILRVQAPIIEAQIIETLLLNLLNFQTLIATKARRIKQIAGDRQLFEFGLRRAQGVGGYHASRAAIIGGFNGTSNVRTGRDYQIPTIGTMAHAFVQSYDSELAAFESFATNNLENCVLLVDTYNTLKSGIPNAIKVAKWLKDRGHQLKGIRLDSGDLAYLSKKARQMLDQAGLKKVKIVASNQLDEYVIKSLLEQKAPIDSFGVGTHLSIGKPDAALDGVYKLAVSNNKPRIKLSENIFKTTLPGDKQVYRVYDNENYFLGADIITLDNENDINNMYHPFDSLKSFNINKHQKKPLLVKVMEQGKSTNQALSLTEIASYSCNRLNLLPEEYKRFNNPHIYKVGLSKKLKLERDQLMQKYKVDKK